MIELGRYRQLAIEKHRYSTNDDDEIERWQLQQFNRVWQAALAANPFYTEWAQVHRLPRQISNLADLRDFPLLTKSDIVKNQDLVFRNLRGVSSIITGGSTGQPARFPKRQDEFAATWASLYAARAWWGIAPTSKLALVWGHSHLYGSGVTRVINLFKRRSLDFVSRTKRLDAYLDSEAQSRHQLDQIVSYRPEYIVGYTSALERLARVCTDHQKTQLAKIGLKGIIAAAETIEPNGARALNDAFNCPVLIEYGAAELGVAAHSRYQTWNLQTLWGSHLLMRTPENELVVTTLNDKAFPLINYATGDIVEVKHELACGSIVTMRSVQGRKQDVVTVTKMDGSPMSMSAIQPVHILKGESEVIGIQLEQKSDNTLIVHVKLTDSEAIERITQNFLRALSRDYPSVNLKSVSIVETEHIELTIAGKVKLFR